MRVLVCLRSCVCVCVRKTIDKTIVENVSYVNEANKLGNYIDSKWFYSPQLPFDSTTDSFAHLIGN